MLSEKTHYYIYVSSLILVVIGLPFSKSFLSMALMLMSANYLLEGNYKKKINLLIQNKAILIFLGIYLLHLFWLINSTNFSYGFFVLKTRIPLLVFPIIFGTSTPVKTKDFKIIIHFLILAVFVSSIICYIHKLTSNLLDYREISIYISHIRFALMINMAIFIIIIALFIKKELKLVPDLYYYPVVIWLFVFLIILHSATGLFVFLSLCVFFLFRYAFLSKNTALKITFLTGSIVILSAISYFMIKEYSNFYPESYPTATELDSLTINGNKYIHELKHPGLENGNIEGVYLCEAELQKEWNKRSKIPYIGQDYKSQEVKFTLRRYLTSKGLRKDSVGVSKLTAGDIKNIENGIANVRYTNNFDPGLVLYNLLWEVHMYRNTGNPNGHSLTQRIEYLKAAFGIIKKNLFFGTGTGDLKDAYTSYYKETNSQLDIKNQRRAHNQFVTFAVAFGISGFIIALISIFGPVFIYRKNISILFVLAFIILLLSMLNDDTLETQTGVTTFTFYYCFFLFLRKKEENSYI
jgi:hypothetical protein